MQCHQALTASEEPIALLNPDNASIPPDRPPSRLRKGRLRPQLPGGYVRLSAGQVPPCPVGSDSRVESAAASTKGHGKRHDATLQRAPGSSQHPDLPLSPFAVVWIPSHPIHHTWIPFPSPPQGKYQHRASPVMSK
ncbi:hypothetical protein UY3_17212 [Chelonia mydas]|uniref:Uncharacterized protein n=1 Tax=Chelonia mydas TaxID=8469 RepID=M7AMH3_CHEMY|nr:hypothetical protein UY3_17212 [Chelonia mydas]